MRARCIHPPPSVAQRHPLPTWTCGALGATNGGKWLADESHLPSHRMCLWWFSFMSVFNGSCAVSRSLGSTCPSSRRKRSPSSARTTILGQYVIYKLTSGRIVCLPTNERRGSRPRTRRTSMRWLIPSLKTKWKLLASTILLLATTTTPHCSACAKAYILDHCVETSRYLWLAHLKESTLAPKLPTPEGCDPPGL